MVCRDCGKEVVLTDRCYREAVEREIYRCHKCAMKFCHSGNKNNHWSGGRYVNAFGYALVNVKYLSKEDKSYVTSKLCGHTFMPEHRLVISRHLKRQLRDGELIHHINGVKDDNRIENLELVNPQEHRAISIMESKWEARIKDLEEENSRLKQDLYELVPD